MLPPGPFFFGPPTQGSTKTMKAAKLFLFGFMLIGFSSGLVGCGEVKNEAIKPDTYTAPPAEEVTKESNSEVIK